MPEKLNSEIAVIGIDIGKNSFHIVGQDRRGALVLRQKWSRGQVEVRLAWKHWRKPQRHRDGQPRRALARGAPSHPQAGTKERSPGTDKGTA
jgi:hypothetical protein